MVWDQWVSEGGDVAADRGSDSGVPYCWARLEDTSGGFAAIIANGNLEGPTTVTISKSGGAFQTSGCKTWQKASCFGQPCWRVQIPAICSS